MTSEKRPAIRMPLSLISKLQSATLSRGAALAALLFLWSCGSGPGAPSQNGFGSLATNPTLNGENAIPPELVAPAAPFSVGVRPATITLKQGNSGFIAVTTRIDSGFDHSLQLKGLGEPADVSLTFNPSTIPAPGSGMSTLNITVGTSVPTGSYPVTITASEGTSSASAKATLKVTSSSGNPNATFKGCWYTQGKDRYQGVDLSVGNPGTYPFNAYLYYGTTCDANTTADQIGNGELIDFGGFGWTFWFDRFPDQTDMSALWYVGSDVSSCVNYATAPDC